MFGKCLICISEVNQLTLPQDMTSAGRCKLIVDNPRLLNSFRIEILVGTGLEPVEDGQFVFGDGVGTGELNRVG